MRFRHSGVGRSLVYSDNYWIPAYAGMTYPVEGDLVVPMESLPDNLKESMGGAWRQKQKNQ